MKEIKPAVFRDHQGAAIASVVDYVQNWLRKHPQGRVFVGCDSKVRGKQVKYATAICLWNIGKGVQEIYRNEVLPRPSDRYTRLWGEVTRAVETAESLKALTKVTVHVDINSNPQYRSHQLYDASMGLITSLGFDAAGKPHSWAASCGAHRHCQ